MRRLAILVLLALAVPTYADDRAARLFEEGKHLVEAGKIDEGCTKLAESLRLDPAIGTRLNLADCREKQARFLEAHTLYTRVVEDASPLRDEVNRSRASYARERLAAIVPRLLRVRLRFSSGVTAIDNLAIDLGGRRLERAEWSVVHVVEPGPVVIEARAPAREPQRLERWGTAGEEIAIEVPMLAGPGGATEQPSKGFRLRPSYIVAAAGGALVITSIVLGLSAKSDYDDAIDADPTPPDVRERVDDARRKGHIATAIGVVGLAGIGTGVYLYIRERRRDRSDGVVVTPATTPDLTSIGIAATGRF